MLPFEALYQSALSAITADTVGFTRFAIDLGPFGGAQSFGALLGPFTVAYVGGDRRRRRCGRSGGATCERATRGSSPHVIPVENIGDWRGQDVVDPNGEKLGKLEEVYFDGETDEPAFVAVKTGLVSKSITLVPLGARERRTRLRARGPPQGRVQEGAELRHRRGADARRRGGDYEHYSLSYTPAGEGARRLAKR